MERASRRSDRDGRPSAQRHSARKNTQALEERVAAQSPLMAKILAITAKAPAKDWRKLPRDLSYNLDHYIYGVPKRSR